jgi:hypothetical protein
MLQVTGNIAGPGRVRLTTFLPGIDPAKLR